MRWPLTLWRATIFDLLRLTIISAGVLVCVVAFAATMKYLVDGRLEPGDALRFMLLTIPPMLAHVLPFAGGFAATLVYHRMALDNEMLAANAGGLSHKSMLVPAAVVALLLGGTLVYLNEQAIPRFLREMQRLVTMEAPRMLANEVQRGRAVKLGNLLVYADAAHRPEKREQGWGTDIRDLVQLARMVAIQTDSEGTVLREFFAKQADLWFMSDAASREAGLSEGVSLMRVRLKNAVTVSPNEGVGRAGFTDEVLYTWSVPQVLKDNPKYLTRSELSALRRTPEAIDVVESRRRTLAFTLSQEAAATEIAAALARGGKVDLVDRNGMPVVVRAAALERREGGWSLKPLANGDVEVEVVRAASQNGTRPRSIAAGKSAELRLEVSNAGGGRLSIGVDLTNAKTRVVGTGAGDRVGGETEKMTFREMGLPSKPESKYATLGSFALLEASRDASAKEGSPIVRAERDLRTSIRDLMRRVTGKQNERIALACACFLMVVIGALTALKFQNSLPLTVYLWTFVPALACIVTISGGQQTVVEAGSGGLILLWAGIAGLVAYAASAYKTISRH